VTFLGVPPVTVGLAISWYMPGPKVVAADLAVEGEVVGAGPARQGDPSGQVDEQRALRVLAVLLRPRVGSVVSITLPLESTATHSVVDGHEAYRAAKKSRLCRGLHAGVASVGFAVVTTAPPSSAARQNDVVGHETVSVCCLLLNGSW
jgi:hypothetical protein